MQTLSHEGDSGQLGSLLKKYLSEKILEPLLYSYRVLIAPGLAIYLLIDSIPELLVGHIGKQLQASGCLLVLLYSTINLISDSVCSRMNVSTPGSKP